MQEMFVQDFMYALSNVMLQLNLYTHASASGQGGIMIYSYIS